MNRVPDISNLGDRPKVIDTVCIAFMVAVTIAVALRVYVRACMLKVFWWDDWFMVATAVSVSLSPPRGAHLPSETGK